jgi:hypothetical protein
VDQRGASRQTGAHCDLGAYETATLPFADDPLVATVTVIRAAHVAQLRLAIDDLRGRFGLSRRQWTDPSLIGVMVKAVHVQELRTALEEVYDAANRARPSFTDPTIAAGMTIRGIHIAELRGAVVALEGP